MALVPVWWFWITLLGMSLATQEADDFRCFDIPQTTADRSSYTIKIGTVAWKSHRLADTVAEIALRELLGFTVHLVPLTGTAHFGTDLAAGIADTDLEQWTPHLGDWQYRAYVTTTQQVYDLGTIGYVGRSGIWTLRSAVEQNRFADYYKFYLNETAAKAAGCWTYGEAGDAPGDSTCDPVADPLVTYCDISGLDGYWTTPSCRASPDACLLVHHITTEWDRGYFEQLVRNNNINAVFGYYGDAFYGRIESFLNTSRFPLFYYWQPDPFLFQLDAVRVSFPDYFTGCDVKFGDPIVVEDAENGTVACDFGEFTMWKAVSHRIRDDAAEAFLFLREYILLANHMDWLLRRMIEMYYYMDYYAYYDYYFSELEQKVSCEFIKQNMALFRSFAPECTTHPPSPVRDGDLVFNAESLQCESVKVFYKTPGTSCSADGQRPGSADRSDRTITLVRRSWTTHDIVSIVTEVILREYLGFNVELVYNNRTDQMQAPQEILTGYYDLDMETWLPNYFNINPELYSPDLDPLITGEVEVLGLTGFSGRSGLFITREALQTNPILDYYKAYQNASELHSIGIASHADTRLPELLGDEFPLCNVSRWSWCGAGSLEGFWAPPSCESQPDRCIEIVHTMPNRDQGMVEQLVKNLGLEAVVAYYGDAGAYSLLTSQMGTGIASPFYWWEPDTALMALDAVRISFPDFYFGCTAGDTLSPYGSVACDFEGIELRKIGVASLRNSVPEAYYALVHMAFFKDMVNSVLAEQQSRPLADAVCDWMAANPERIEEWTPTCLRSPLEPAEVRAGDLVFDPQELLCKPIVCEANEVLRYVAASRTYYCDQCEDGTVPNDWQTLCEPCPAGKEVSGTSGQCSPCDPGKFKTAEGKVCDSCADGRFMPESGQSACNFCNSTSYQDETGALDCKLCEEVVVGSVTPILGATASLYCHCHEGTYLPWNSSTCEACPHGMACPEGADARNFPSTAVAPSDAQRPYPRVLGGYMTIPAAPFTVYECLNQQHCPGGAPGNCAHLRDSSSVACGLCVENAYAKENGCAKCASLDALPLILMTTLGLVGAVGVALVANRNLLMKSSAVLMAVMMSGIMITALQTLAVFKQISVDWFEPFSQVFQTLKMISFDLEILRMGCVMGNNELRQYTFRQLVAPACVVLLLFTLVIKKHFRPQTVVVNEFVNTVGTIFNIFFISIIISCVSPLVCYPHPGSSGRSVVGNPATLCNFEDDHVFVVAIGFVASLCIPVPFLTLITYGITRYPHHVRSTLDAQWFLASFRFLFMRFHPSAYYFGAVVVARGVCCCLVPVLLDQPGVQVVLMALIIGTYVLVQQFLQPWRAKLANVVDGLLGFLLLLILLCLAVLTELTGTQAVPAVAMVGFIGLLLAPVGIIGYTLVQKIVRKSFHMFICHHKADAAAQSRLLKMLLTAKTGKRIFIDSDDLVELDKLFDVVKTRVQLLLVYLTKDTLTRPWCVGEITTNWACNGKVATIKTPSFVQPSQDESKQLHLLVDTTSCNLQEQGITVDAMALALSKVVFAPAVIMDVAEKGSRKFLTVVERVAHHDYDGKTVAPSGRSAKCAVSLGAVVLCADVNDDEAVAATAIVGKKIEMQVHSYVEGGVVNLNDIEDMKPFAEVEYVESSRACVVLLSRGTLERMTQVAIIVRGMSSPCTVMIPLTLWDFKFPTLSFYETTLPNMWLDTLGHTTEEAQAWMRAFFNLIAISFSTMSTDNILDTQSKQVVERVPRSFEKSRGSKGTRETSSSNLSAERPTGKQTSGGSSTIAKDVKLAAVSAGAACVGEAEHEDSDDGQAVISRI